MKPVEAVEELDRGFDDGIDDSVEFESGRGTYVIDSHHVDMLNITKMTKSLTDKEIEIIRVTTLATEAATRLELQGHLRKNFIAVFSSIYPEIRKKNNKFLISTIITMKRLGLVIDANDIYEKFSDYVENIEQVKRIIYDALGYMRKYDIPSKAEPLVKYINYYIDKASRSLNIEKYRLSIFNVAMSLSKQYPSLKPSTIVGHAIRIVSDFYGLDITLSDIRKVLNLRRNISMNNIEVIII